MKPPDTNGGLILKISWTKYLKVSLKKKAISDGDLMNRRLVIKEKHNFLCLCYVLRQFMEQIISFTHLYAYDFML